MLLTLVQNRFINLGNIKSGLARLLNPIYLIVDILTECQTVHYFPNALPPKWVENFQCLVPPQREYNIDTN